MKFMRAMLSKVAGAVAAVCVLALGMGTQPVFAQSATPAGNSHPQTQLLAKEGLVNPFGEPARTGMDVATKQKLAAEVDLKLLGELALYHNGRVKVLQTLAEETVESITGRKNHVDLVPEQVGGETKYRKVKYDPTFTFMDMIIDPGYYDDKPLIGVNYLPLRDALLERVFTDKTVQAGHNVDDVRETWRRLGRLTPAMVGSHLHEVSDNAKLTQEMQRGLGNVHQAMQLYLASSGNLEMVPGANKDEAWKHLSTLNPQSAAGKAVFELGQAWRKGDAAGVNAAAAVLKRELPAINPELYPAQRLQLEMVYNRVNFFEWGMWLYAGATLGLLLAFGTGRAWLRVMGIGLLLAAVSVHFAGFGLRAMIAERYVIQNQFESMTGVSLFAAIVGLFLASWRKQLIFAAAAAGVGFMILVTATQTGIPGQAINREAAILNTSVLLKYHVTTVLLSYGLIALGLMVALFYLGTYYLGGGRQEMMAVAEKSEPRQQMPAGVMGIMSPAVLVSAGALSETESQASGVAAAGKTRVLADLDKAHMTILQLAFWTLGVGILLGAWWADHSWGRWWAFDPKETWALVTWIVYLVVIHVRVSGAKNRGLVTAWLSVAGFIAMLWCYFGVNLLLPGLHAYA
jgi:cytochrome c-type biogenesis protein CcsB